MRLNLLVIALTACAAGCAHYQPAPIDARHGADQFGARSLGDPALREDVNRMLAHPIDAWPPESWDRGQLLAVALIRNPSLSVAQAQVQAALAHEITAKERPNPDVTLQSEYARHDQYAWLYGVSLSWLLQSGERRRLEGDIARMETLNARLQFTDQAWSVRKDLAASLSDWEAARRRLALLDRLAGLQERLLDLERRRIAAGEDPPSEILAAENDRLEIEQEHAQSLSAATAAQSAAARAIGIPPQALDGVRLAWPDWGEPPSVAADALHSAREQALLSRADLRIAIDEYTAAEARLRLAIRRQYPQLTLQPGYYWDHGIAKFPFNVSFEVAVNRNRGEIAEARAARELAGQRMLAVQAGIFGEIAEAERAESVARTSMESAERQLQTARRQQQQTALAVRVGALSTLEQLGGEIAAVRAEIEVVQVRALLQGTRNSLEDVLRVPLSGPELSLALPVSAPSPERGP